MHAIRFGFDLKFIAIRSQIAMSRYIAMQGLDWLPKLSRLCSAVLYGVQCRMNSSFNALSTYCRKLIHGVVFVMTLLSLAVSN